MRNTNKKKGCYTIFYFLIIVIIILLTFMSGESFIVLFVLIVKSILSVILSYFIGTALHELGHLVFGLIAGYKFVSFKILFFNFYDENSRIKFRVEGFRKFAGYCSMFPKYKPIYIYWLSVFGGALFNLISAIIFFIIWRNSGFNSILFSSLAIISFLLFAFNLLPIKKTNEVYYDGWILWTLLFNRKSKEEFLEQVKYADMVNKNLRPRDYELQLDKTKPFNSSYISALYRKSLDLGDIETMQYCSSQIEENFDTSSEVSHVVYCYIICYTACITGNIDKANDYYNKVKNRIENDNDCNGLRVRAYYQYYSNKEYEYAYELCKQGILVVDKYVHPGIAMMEKDLLLSLKKKIELEKSEYINL
ncbi:MAG: hypothetical protein AB1Z23_12580 [Eubacteriales bacterium]